MIFIGESLPSFGSILDLVGGSTIALMSIVFPCLFYMYLSALDKKIPKKIKDYDVNVKKKPYLCNIKPFEENSILPFSE